MTALRVRLYEPAQVRAAAVLDAALATPFGYSVEQLFCADDVRRLGAELAVAARADTRARLVVDSLLRWRVDELAPQRGKREPVVLRRSDIGDARLLLVLGVEALPTVEALRAYRFEYCNVPLDALTGLGTLAPDAAAIVAARPRQPGEAAERADVEAAQQFRAGTHPLQARFEREQPVSLDMFVRSALDPPADATDGSAVERSERPKHVWYASCVQRQAYCIALTLRGYVLPDTVTARANAVPHGDELFYSLAPGHLRREPTQPARRPTSAVQLRRVEEIERSESNGPLIASERPHRGEAIERSESNGPLIAPARPSDHPFARLAPLGLPLLTLYEIDRATRNRLTVLLLVCEQYTQRAKTLRIEERSADTYYIRQYPNGPGAPARSKDTPGRIGQLTGSQYATLGLAVACVVVAPDERLRLWLLEAELQLLEYRGITADVDKHLERIERQCGACAQPAPDTPLGALIGAIRTDLSKRV